MDTEIAEAIEHIVEMSRNDLISAFVTAFGSPKPKLSPNIIDDIVSASKSPHVQSWLEPISKPSTSGQPVGPPQVKYYDHHYTYPDGTRASRGVYGHEIPPSLQSKSLDAVWREIILKRVFPEKDVTKFAGVSLEKLLAEAGHAIKAAEKVGRSTGPGEGTVHDKYRASVTRYVVKEAMLNGAWQSAAMTAVFDVKLLLDRKFVQYLTKIGVSGLYGGTLQSLSSWIKHPFFRNGAVLGVCIGAAFGVVPLASTGDWERFGKSLGLSIAGGAAAWGGRAVAMYLVSGFTLGPFGLIVTGAAAAVGGYYGNKIAGMVPSLGGLTKYEVTKMHNTITQQFSLACMEPDPSLSKEQVVAQFMEQTKDSKGVFLVRMTGSYAADLIDLRVALTEFRSTSPEGFRALLEALRSASKA